MENLVIPVNYRSELNLYDTQEAIKTIKDFFQQALAEQLTLLRVTAPLFVTPESGLNDNLNGVERPVSFDIKEQNGQTAEIVHSLAKWKRYALKNRDCITQFLGGITQLLETFHNVRNQLCALCVVDIRHVVNEDKRFANQFIACVSDVYLATDGTSSQLLC